MPTVEKRTTRIEIRTQAKRAARIRYAAQLTQTTMSGFMLDVATERAEDIISGATATVVPAKFFDALWKALDASPAPNAALARRARGPRRVVQR